MNKREKERLDNGVELVLSLRKEWSTAHDVWFDVKDRTEQNATKREVLGSLLRMVSTGKVHRSKHLPGSAVYRLPLKPPNQNFMQQKQIEKVQTSSMFESINPLSLLDAYLSNTKEFEKIGWDVLEEQKKLNTAVSMIEADIGISTADKSDYFLAGILLGYLTGRVQS